MFFYLLLSYIFIQRTVGGAGAVVLPFFVHAECVPRRGAINVFFVYVVHAHGDSQHRTHRDKVCADMAVRNRAVVRSPVIHYVVRALERAFARYSRRKPRAWPRVSSFIALSSKRQ